MDHKRAFIDEFGNTRLPLASAKILPSLSTPVYTTASGASHVRSGDDVLGLTYKGVSRAYPTWIMDNYHIVNDVFGDAGLLVVH